MVSKEKGTVRKMAELIGQLEDGTMDTKMLDQKTRWECAAFLINRKYKNAEIKRILKVSIRQVQRYLEQYKKEIRQKLGESFQQDLIAVYTNDMRLLMQTLWKKIDFETLSPTEFLRYINSIHKMVMDKFSMEIKLGYIQESQVREEVVRAYDQAVEDREQEEVSRQPWIHDKRLTPEQITELKHFFISENRAYPHKTKELTERMKVLVEIAADENEFLRQRSIDIALESGGLRCSVNVVNRLQRYGY